MFKQFQYWPMRHLRYCIHSLIHSFVRLMFLTVIGASAIIIEVEPVNDQECQMMPKMHTETLQSAGLKILASHNLKLVHDATKRGKIFRTQDGRSVRVRTNIKRSIPCKSQDTNLRRGTLDIEGTEFICLIVPKSAGNAAEVEVYFMPTSIAVREVKEAHIKWLEYGKSKGTNFTPALCLDRVPSGKEKNLNDLWSEYRFE